MSRFWAAESSSEDEKDSDNDSLSDVAPVQKQVEKKFAGTYDESDSDSEDEVRVVKSQKDRKWDSIREGIARLRNARKNSDWPMIQDEFANVNKMIEKSKMLILQSGLPPFYVKMLAEVEEHVQLALKDKEGIKKMKPVVSRALNQMKLQVRKHNENYKTEIADCRANPEKYQEVEPEADSSSDDSSSDSDSSDDSSDDSGSDSDASSESEKPKAKKATKVVSDSDDDSLFGGDDADDSSSSSESEDDGRRELKGRARWLKKAPTANDNKKKEEFVKKDRVIIQKKKEYADPAAAKRAANAYVEVKLSEEELERKLNELLALRGKRTTDSRDTLRQLEVLTKASRLHGPRREIPVLMHLISNMLDSQRSIDDYLEHHQWRTCYRSLYRVVSLMEANKKLTFASLTSDDGTDVGVAAHLKAAATTVEEEVVPSDPNVLKVAGSIASYIVRLQDEYTKSLQQINPHTKEYVVRLADEASLVELAEFVLTHYLRIGDSKSAASVSQLIVDHMYYKHDSHAIAVRRAHLFNKTWGRYTDLHPACVGKITMPTENKAFPSATMINPAAFLGNPSVNPPSFNPGQRLQELCTYIFKYGDKRIKTHALLALVHHHALHDRYYKARDLLLISHIQEFADKFDVKTQILYNRAIVTLGLCAFRLGLYQKAHDCLTGICSGRVKELLAQGQMRWADKDPEQEKIERRRQMPFHMHINPDLLELCHLASAMILELPHLARSSTGHAGAHPTVISRQFRKYLSGYSKQAFRGPPENTREHVLAATKALLSGEWQKAMDLLMGLEVWKLIPNDGAESAKVLLSARIQEEAVRTYLLLNGDHYESLSLPYLCEMFGMDETITRRIISRMIFNREISAAWDSDNTLVMYKTEPSTLQTLSQGLAEKLSLLLESNERILDPLVGVYGFKDDWSNRGGESRGGKFSTEQAGSRGSGGGKFRTNGNYKSGSRPVVTRQQQTNPRTGRDVKSRSSGNTTIGSSNTTGSSTAPKNVWNAASKTSSKPKIEGTPSALPSQPPVAAATVSQTTPRKWGMA